MKKIICIITSVLLSAAVALMPVSAAEKNKTDTKKDSGKSSSSASTSIIPTICFDTDHILTQRNPSDKESPMLTNFGEFDRTGMTLAIDRTVARTNASLSITQDFSGVLEKGQNNTGFYITASNFGLETFAGTEITAYVYALNSGADKLRLFTDGDVISYSNDIALTNSPRWEKVVLTVPENVNNEKFGVMVTSSKGYSGTVCYLDDITVKDSSGKAIANIGDFKPVTEGKTAGAFTVFLCVILILAVAGGCAVFVLRMLHRYR